jgi:hypothetical protein
MTSAASDFAIPSAPAGVVRELPVPQLSQEVHRGHFPEYDNGGEAWCSPTSTAMVLDYWKAAGYPVAAQHQRNWPRSQARLMSTVRSTTRPYVYDWNYQGAGNMAGQHRHTPHRSPA